MAMPDPVPGGGTWMASIEWNRVEYLGDSKGVSTYGGKAASSFQISFSFCVRAANNKRPDNAKTTKQVNDEEREGNSPRIKVRKRKQKITFHAIVHRIY